MQPNVRTAMLAVLMAVLGLAGCDKDTSTTPGPDAGQPPDASTPDGGYTGPRAESCAHRR